MLNEKNLNSLRERFPIGCRVVLLQMEDEYAPPRGMLGSVTGIDSTGSLLVDWDNGSGLNVLYGIDRVRKVADSI